MLKQENPEVTGLPKPPIQIRFPGVLATVIIQKSEGRKATYWGQINLRTVPQLKWKRQSSYSSPVLSASRSLPEPQPTVHVPSCLPSPFSRRSPPPAPPRL